MSETAPPNNLSSECCLESGEACGPFIELERELEVCNAIIKDVYEAIGHSQFSAEPLGAAVRRVLGSSAPPAGMVLVPEEATEEMLLAGNVILNFTKLAPEVYRAMRDARPMPPPGLEGWQEMSSAPKDGTLFDVWYPHHAAAEPTPAHRVTDVYWSDIQEDFCTYGDYGPEEPSPLALYPRPTHWRPLPAPPSAGGEDG